MIALNYLIGNNLKLPTSCKNCPFMVPTGSPEYIQCTLLGDVEVSKRNQERGYGSYMSDDLIWSGQDVLCHGGDWAKQIQTKSNNMFILVDSFGKTKTTESLDEVIYEIFSEKEDFIAIIKVKDGGTTSIKVNDIKKILINTLQEKFTF